MRSREQASLLADGARPAQRDRRRAARLSVCACAALLAAISSLGLLALPGVPAARPARAAAARPAALSCNGACVGITAPQFTGTAEGPVGAHLTVEGANWPVNTTLTIWPVLNQDACMQAPPPSPVSGTLTVDTIGNASGSYTWPTSLNTLNTPYILCGSDGALTTMPGVQDPAAPPMYTVLAADPPDITLSSLTITQGAVLIVRGQSWLPGQQTVTVNICSDATCSAQPVLSQQATSTNDGTITVQFSTSTSLPAGTYYVQATANNGALTAPRTGPSVPLMVNAPPTATPSPSPQPTATPTPAPAPTHSTGGNGTTPLLILVLGTLSLLFLIGGIISLAVYARAGP